MKNFFILLTTVFAFLICCSNSKSTVDVDNTQKDSLTVAIENFKKDGSGCLGLRTNKSINFIYQKSGIKGKSKTELISLIGIPNDSVSANGLLNYKYYFGRTCSNAVPVDSVESCWSMFHIELVTNKVSGVEYVCQ